MEACYLTERIAEIRGFENLKIGSQSCPSFKTQKLDIAISSAVEHLHKTISRRLQRISAEWNIPISRARSPDEIESVCQFETQEGFDQQAYHKVPWDIERILSQYQKVCLFDDLDVFALIKSLRVPDETRGGSSHMFDKYWSQLPYKLPVKFIEQYRFMFRELHPRNRQLGFDDVCGAEKDRAAFLKAHVEKGEQVLESKSLPAMRKYARFGIPAWLRSKIWDSILQSSETDNYPEFVESHCSKLSNDIFRYDRLLDRILDVDIRQCQEDDQFFVFEDMLRDVMLFWSRDDWVMQNPRHQGQCHPFWGMALYAMPVCYLHHDSRFAYFTFRELYSRYFFGLHNPLPSSTPSIVTLCHDFECILKQMNSALFLHLLTIGSSPVRYAFRWMSSAFVGVLDVSEWLLLWDRVVGFDSVDILVAAAACVFASKADALFAAKDDDDVERAFADLRHRARIVPLLQAHLFAL